MNEYLFSYGTLQKDNVQLNLFGRLLLGSNDVLKGHKLAPIEIRDEVFLAKGEGNYQRIAFRTNDINDVIEGMVFEVTAEELAHADKYEPNDYARVEVELASGRKAWVYAAAG